MIDSKIASGSLVVLSFSPGEIKSLKWIKKNEFMFKDEMYDIVIHKKGENGRIIFYCYPDKKEKKLLAEFEMHVQKNMENAAGNQKNEQNSFKNLLKDYCPPELISGIQINVTEIHYCSSAYELKSLHPEDQSPPPKFS